MILVFDPHEAANLAEKPDAALILAEMRRKLDRWMEKTDDPLLHGPILLPPNAIVSDPDAP